jgi:hypothetical protein
LMKRTIAVLFFILAAAMTFAQNPEAVIREITGTVELKAAGSEVWRPAKAGDRIPQSTIISTGFKSMALLAVGNSTLTVRPLTRLSLEALIKQENTESVNIGLQTGRVRVDVKPPAGTRADITVQSPIATASVRGTEFEMSPVTLRVHDGNVLYRSAGENARTVMVREGQRAQVDSTSGKVTNPYIQAEEDRRLPSLPGTTPGPESGARLKVARGTAEGDISLVWGNQ